MMINGLAPLTAAQRYNEDTRDDGRGQRNQEDYPHVARWKAPCQKLHGAEPLRYGRGSEGGGGELPALRCL
jgi:hypothetical protein